jgi:hypothetical protein
MCHKSVTNIPLALDSPLEFFDRIANGIKVGKVELQKDWYPSTCFIFYPFNRVVRLRLATCGKINFGVLI